MERQVDWEVAKENMWRAFRSTNDRVDFEIYRNEKERPTITLLSHAQPEQKYLDQTLMAATHQNQRQNVQNLLLVGASIKFRHSLLGSPLWIACSSGHEDVVKLLLDSGANVEPRSTFEDTPLPKVCFEDYDEVVGLLLRKGTKVGSKGLKCKFDTKGSGLSKCNVY